MRPYIEVIPAWRHVVHVRRNEADDSVQMVGHDDEGIQHHLIAHRLGPLPLRHRDAPMRVERHAPAPDHAKKTPAIVGADRHEIRSEGPVIEGGVTGVRALRHLGACTCRGEASSGRHIAAGLHNVGCSSVGRMAMRPTLDPVRWASGRCGVHSGREPRCRLREGLGRSLQFECAHADGRRRPGGR